MFIFRERAFELLDPKVAARNARFSTGIRGEQIKGGMGAMNKVALRGRVRGAKQLLNPDNEELVRRFINEQKVMQILNGNIAPQYDGVEVVDGRRYILMEWIEGMTLEQLTALHGGRIPPEKACSVLASFAAASANLVKKYGIYHRDNKPNNVMVNANTGEVKIIDYGIAAMESGSNFHQSLDGTVMGTPPYMSKDQFTNFSGLDERNETFAIGATAFYVLTGEAPCPGANKHLSWDGTVDLSKVPEEAREWLAQLLHKDINSRLAVNEAGRFAFERSEYALSHSCWEEFLENSNARRSVNPKRLFAIDADLALNLRSEDSLQRTKKGPITMPHRRVFTLKNGIILAVTVVLGGAITVGGTLYSLLKHTDEDPTKDGTRPTDIKNGNNGLDKGRKKRFPTILFTEDEKGRRKITFQGKGERNGEVQRLAEISAERGVHIRQKNGSILGSRRIVDEKTMADILGVDLSKLPKEWEGSRWAWDVHNNGRSGFFASGIGWFLRRPDGTLIVFATDRGKGLAIVQGCGIGNIFGYKDRHNNPDFMALFDDIVTSNIRDEDVEIGDVSNFPNSAPNAPNISPQRWTRGQWRMNLADVIGDEQTFISKGQRKD